jgi:hypothetical protein
LKQAKVEAVVVCFSVPSSRTAVSSQIGFKSSVMTRVQYMGFPYLEKDKVM